MYIAKTGDFFNFSIERPTLYKVLDALKKNQSGEPQSLLALNMTKSEIGLYAF